MKIGVISDTHFESNYSKECIELLTSQGAQYLIHAGDVCLKENLDQLKESNLPYVAVFGNNDGAMYSYMDDYNIHSEPYYFKIEDTSFKLMHLPMYLNADSDVVIYGHTHIFESEFVNGTLFLNSGEVCGRKYSKVECVLLEITPTQYLVNYYFRTLNEKEFTKKEIRYERK